MLIMDPDPDPDLIVTGAKLLRRRFLRISAVVGLFLRPGVKVRVVGRSHVGDLATIGRPGILLKIFLELMTRWVDRMPVSMLNRRTWD